MQREESKLIMTRAVVQVLKLVFDGPNFVLISIFYALKCVEVDFNLWNATRAHTNLINLTALIRCADMIQTNEAFLKVAVLDRACIHFKNFSEINKFLLSQGHY